MLYNWKVRALKVPALNILWRRWSARRGDAVGSYADLPSYIRRYARGKSFADIGCLWGVNGEYVRGLKNAAVFWPMMDERSRAFWSLRPLGVSHQAGISTEFRPADGYSNWFWGLTPSCLTSLLQTAGFRIEHRAPEAFAQTLVCTAAEASFEHALPGEAEARDIGLAVSRSGAARPA